METTATGPTVYPSPETIANFRVPLEPGEEHLLRVLQETLDDTYEIFVQPFLNGDRPDLVVLRKGSGMLIIEVKDWDLDAYEVGDDPRDAWRLRNHNGSVRSPLQQVETYKQNVYNLHVRELFEAQVDKPQAFGLVHTAVYFHNATSSELHQRVGRAGHVHTLGRDDLSGPKLQNVLHQSWLSRKSKFFTDELYAAVRRYLKPPIHTPDEGKHITYTPQQQRLIGSAANTRQKVRGVAGSGKTKVLAKRAVNAHKRTGKRVLILTFNITLRNYIHDRISEVRERFEWAAFHIVNYHEFFKQQANRYGLSFEGYRDLLEAADDQYFFTSAAERIQPYGAIFVDEVQDYKESWLRLIERYFLASDGEFVVFGDEKQNVYGRTMDADQFPVVPTIPGRWNQLTTSFRMNEPGLRLAQAFQKQYLAERYAVDSTVALEQGELFEIGGEIRYFERPEASPEEVFDLLYEQITELDMHPNDVAVLGPEIDILRLLEQHFRKHKGEQTAHAFETQEVYEALLSEHTADGAMGPARDESFEMALKRKRRPFKVHFWANSGTVKLATIHSFKGWEAAMVVLVLTDSDTTDEGGSTQELIYTALTRFGKHLVVIDQTGGTYRAFFEQVADRVDSAPAADTFHAATFQPDDDLPF
ncbi:MAG: AAA family ATPase [Bacteroidetes bacterium]|jgi:hypothetical protein|nr:AAA family ATPase [Bacteroidota bacterium]